MGHPTAYGEIALCRFASSQPLADLVCDLMFPSSQPGERSVLHGLFLKFDRHVWLVARIEGEAAIALKLFGYQSIRSSGKDNGARTITQRWVEDCEVCCFVFG